jgi:hypothetical protein
MQVAKTVLALTTLNFNARKLDDGEPVTIAFSRAVDEILVSKPAAKHARPSFKYHI